MTDREQPRIHDPKHPYVRNLIGCGHGRLFTEPCVDCEVVALMERYKSALQTIWRVQARMQQLGRTMPDQQGKTMADRELTERAAKAAGLYSVDPADHRDEHGAPAHPTCGMQLIGGVWNPLLDDGDALRLAVKLNMGISIPVMRTPMADVITFRDSSVNIRETGDDPCAATRRAIVRAAAEIGKEMK